MGRRVGASKLIPMSTSNLEGYWIKSQKLILTFWFCLLYETDMEVSHVNIWHT